MKNLATKKAANQLQKLFDVLGEYGGQIKTNDPAHWWNLDLEVEHIDEDGKTIQVGVFKEVNGDIAYDPLFYATLTMDGNKIAEVELTGYESQTMFGMVQIDSEDMCYSDFGDGKDEFGLKKRFSSFMTNMVDFGPYVREPKEISKYDRTLEDG